MFIYNDATLQYLTELDDREERAAVPPHTDRAIAPAAMGGFARLMQMLRSCFPLKNKEV